jgi:hypothetical protein
MSSISIANITGAVDDEFTDKNSQFVIAGAITNVVNIVGSVSTSNFKNTAALAVPAILGVTLYLSGSATSRLGTPIASFLRYNNSTQNSFTAPTNIALTNQTLYTPGVATGHPATTNVRTGIVYGPTNNLTGTCAVPPAAAVSLGVPVDNTVGTASLDANALAAALNTSLSASLPTPISASLQASLPTPISASLQASLPTPIATALNTSLSASLPAAIAPLLWDESVTNITTPNSIGERLKNCSTVATTGAQIASFNP